MKVDFNLMRFTTCKRMDELGAILDEVLNDNQVRISDEQRKLISRKFNNAALLVNSFNYLHDGDIEGSEELENYINQIGGRM